MTIKPLELNNLGKNFGLLNDISNPNFKFNCYALDKLTDGAKMHIAASIGAFKIYIAPDKLAARSVQEKLTSWGIRVGYLPEREDILINRKNYTSNEDNRERIATLDKLARKELDVLVISAETALQKFPKPDIINKYSIDINVEDEIDPTDLVKKLINAGFIRGEIVAEPGEIALRGDVLDICIKEGECLRVSFFDELIESIKVVDLETMKSKSELNKLHLAPLSEALISYETVEKAKKRLLVASQTSKIAGEMVELLHEGSCDSSILWALPFFAEDYVNLFEFTNYPVVIIDEPKMVYDSIHMHRVQFESRYARLMDGKEILKDHFLSILIEEQFYAYLKKCRVLLFASLGMFGTVLRPEKLISIKCRTVAKYYLDHKKFVIDLKLFKQDKFRVIICCGDKDSATTIFASLERNGIDVLYAEDIPENDGVYVTTLPITQGVIYPDEKVALIGFTDCIGKKHESVLNLQKTMFTDPKLGDYVVHRVHGIGICDGTTILKHGEEEKEYYIIRFRDDEILYVSTDQTENLQKYVGHDTPRLNKMGGKEFAKQKEKVKESVKKLAINLLELYAQRESMKGFKYDKDNDWQKAFEDEFEYDETPDQLTAIAEIKKDMETGKLMDRLIIGDVGFGKTEVAFRAMFKTVMGGKQAMLLAPTTILARQHYENIKDRAEKFGVKVALLTRLQTGAENQRTIDGINSGNIDMVICTHKGLNNKIEFKDLGLLVLDEEQRFGVEHKETIKNKYPIVNVLTLSATPIPRTLNMALSGLRDISMLETAPRGRLPIQTYIVEYTDSIVIDAIVSEKAREGQTFILLNNIDQLDIYADSLRAQLPPDIKIITANGQMSGKEIESRMAAFYEKKADVLICTTIIENGIDIPDANTLIVLDSHKFGLSQLYQIRGRVGRRGKLAYAYLTIPKGYMLTPDAGKRLQTLMDNTEIGSGYKVAMSDLSLRGAGNLLGAEQSGHIRTVGYQMYLEMLNDAIEELKTGVVKKEKKPIEVNANIVAFVRDGYVDSREKTRLYRQISSIYTKKEKEELVKDLVEGYGNLDEPMKNFIDLTLVKHMLEPYNVKKFVINPGAAGVVFADTDVFRNEAMMKTVANHPKDVILTNTIPPSLIFDTQKKTIREIFDAIIDFFEEVRNS